MVQRNGRILGVALIGSGIWAREEHLPAIQASEHLRLKAIYSRSLKSSKSLAADLDDVDVYADDSEGSYDDLLKRPDIDAVVIALPIKSQQDYIRSALLAGKHVLSEKPVAENVNDARDLIDWYRKEHQNQATWHVAENWRFLASVAAAREEASKHGRILGFRIRIYDNIQKGGKFYETDWRKTPTHQGGFLLDGGVHYAAGLRRLLASQPGNEVARLSAFTSCVQEHLPPVDTINATLQLRSGIGGTYQQSVGASLTGCEWTVGCENGVVTVADSRVTISAGGKIEEKSVLDERTGVPPAVRAWAAAIAEAVTVRDLEPEEALADLELIELMLRSGEAQGTPMVCKYQG